MSAKVGGLARALVVLPLLTLACTSANPSFGLDEGASAEDTSDTGSAADANSASSAEGPVLTSGADGTTSTGAPPVDSSSTNDEPGSTSSETTATAEPVEHVFYAYLGDCVHPPMPNPDACTEITDPGYIQTDGEELDLGGEVVGYIAFEIGAELAGTEVLSVKLRMMAHPFDPGDPTGIIWEVEPFTHDSLFDVAPAPIGDGPVGPSAGAVPASLVVEIELDPTAIVPGQPLFLGIYPESSDGVDYLDEESELPPELVVTVL